MDHMGMEEDNLELEKRIALALGVVLGSLLKTTYEDLGHLYAKLRLGGGLIKGRPLTEELGKATRYELVPYLAALVVALVQEWPNRAIPPAGILGHFEKMVFSLDLESTKPVYAFYLDRYYHPSRFDSTSLPRETIIHSEFLQRLAKTWSVSQNSTDARRLEYVQDLGKLMSQNESSIRDALTGIWP